MRNDIDKFNTCPGNTPYDRFIMQFVCYTAVNLCMLQFMCYPSASIGSPFFPVDPYVPYSTISTGIITKETFIYLNYYYLAVAPVGACGIGREWLRCCDKYYKMYGSILRPGTPLDPARAIYDTTIGFTDYYEKRMTILNRQIDDLTHRKNEIDMMINQSRARIVDNMETISKNHAAKFRKAMVVSTEHSVNSIEAIQSKKVESVDEIISLHERVMS